MKILSAAQIRQLDAYTITHEPIASVDLMERAARSLVTWFTGKFDTKKRILIFCGTGNNGGDGLAIARMLLKQGYSVHTFVVRYSDTASNDFAANYERLSPIASVSDIRQTADIPAIEPDTITIDALFGSGLSRPVADLAAEVIRAINQSESTVIAIDLPSGLLVDAPNPDETIIQADYTVSFQLPKLSFLLPQNMQYVGEWHVTDIGLHPKAIAAAQTNNYYVDEAFIASLVKPRVKFSHKGLYGHALLVCGSYGKMGAAVLAAQACLRSGVGLLTLHVPRCGYTILQVAVPEAMTITDASETHLTHVGDLEKFDTVGIGPGLGTATETARALEQLLQPYKKPVVIDADGLNVLAQHKALLDLLPEHSILTPHPKEFERLAGKTANDYERLDVLRRFSAQYRVIVVLKGAHTATALPSGELYFNSTGNPGMATGGTGDVLTGILTSLLAQKQYTPNEAALLGVYLHGLAGNYAARQKGYAGLIASDVTNFLPQAFMQFGL